MNRTLALVTVALMSSVGLGCESLAYVDDPVESSPTLAAPVPGCPACGITSATTDSGSTGSAGGGGTSGSTTSDSGTTGTTGTVGGQGGGGGSPVDAGTDAPATVPRGAVFVRTTQPDPAVCPLAGNIGAVGSVNAVGESLVEDGHGAQITCGIVNIGPGHFAVTGTVAGGGVSVQVEIPDVSLVDQSNAVAGTVRMSASWTGGDEFAGACRFWFGASQGLDSTSAWMAFACDGVAHGTSVCPVAEGYVAFDGCSAP